VPLRSRWEVRCRLSRAHAMRRSPPREASASLVCSANAQLPLEKLNTPSPGSSRRRNRSRTRGRQPPPARVAALRSARSSGQAHGRLPRSSCWLEPSQACPDWRCQPTSSSSGPLREDIDLSGVGDDARCRAVVVAAGRSAAEQVDDSADNAGITQGDEPGFKHARAMVSAQGAVVQAANGLGADSVHQTLGAANRWSGRRGRPAR
jgi:hypothetical protein